MNAKQQAKLRMYLTLRIYLLSNQSITSRLPNFQEFMTALDAAIEQIQANSEERHVDTSGVTDYKQENRDEVEKLTLDASGKMQAYAKYKRDTILLAETKFTKTALLRVSALDLLDIANGLYARINAHLGDAASYDLSPDSQRQYREAIDAFSASIPQPRQSQLKTKENGQLINLGIAMADDAVENIDSVVEVVRLSEPVFYKGYKNARRVIELGTGSLQVQGKITEADGAKPIPGAVLTFRLKGETAVALEKETADKGGFSIKSFPEGIYEVTISKVGFKTLTVSATVRWDELCNIDAALEKIG